jgi:hypothetical protein
VDSIQLALNMPAVKVVGTFHLADHSLLELSNERNAQILDKRGAQNLPEWNRAALPRKAASAINQVIRTRLTFIRTASGLDMIVVAMTPDTISRALGNMVISRAALALVMSGISREEIENGSDSAPSISVSLRPTTLTATTGSGAVMKS